MVDKLTVEFLSDKFMWLICLACFFSISPAWSPVYYCWLVVQKQIK